MKTITHSTSAKLFFKLDVYSYLSLEHNENTAMRKRSKLQVETKSSCNNKHPKGIIIAITNNID
jgi:hypothetical protein